MRVGVIGVGYGQRVLIPAFRASQNCTVAAVCASTHERAQGVADHLGIPKAYGDWRQLVAAPDIEAIAIAVPPVIQPAIVKAVVANQKHVFCEKPLATDRETAAELVSAVRQAGVANIVDFEFPMIEPWQQAKALLDRAALGKVRHATVSWQFESSTNRLRRESWKARTDDGGGVVNLYVSHIFHYLEWLLGPIHRLSARLFPRATQSGSSEDLAVLWLVLSDGTPVSVTVSSQARFGTGHRVEVYGEQGSLVLENSTSSYVSGFRLWSGDRDQGRLVEVPVSSQPVTSGDDRITPVRRLVERFVRWTDQGIPSSPTLEEGYRVQCLIDAAREADRTEQWVEVAEELALQKSGGIGHRGEV